MLGLEMLFVDSPMKEDCGYRLPIALSDHGLCWLRQWCFSLEVHKIQSVARGSGRLNLVKGESII
jgi:hypothetical protein